MLYGEIMAVCSEILTKHKNTVCGQNVELLNFKLVGHIVTTGLAVKIQSRRRKVDPYLPMRSSKSAPRIFET